MKENQFLVSNIKGGLKALSAVTLFAVLTFTSCENFMSGALVKDMIDDEIEYTNAKPTKVTVSASKDATELLIPAIGTYSYKKGDPIELNFTVSDSYKFLYWEAVPASDIKFSDRKAPETVAKLLNYADVVSISPKCILRPAVEKFSPQNVESGVCKNSSIKITFNKQLADKTNFSRISITMNGDSIKNHFDEPFVDTDGKTVIFRANKNLIDLTSGIKTINVKIPGDYYYVEENNKIEIGNDVELYYNINSSTNEKAKISFELPDINCGSLTPNTTNSNPIEYNWGTTEAVKFTVADNWQFFGWIVENGDGVVEIEDPEEFKTNVKILDQCDDTVTIRPVVFEKPQITGFEPENTAAGVERNSAIKIKFNKPISNENDLSRIKITMEGKNVYQNFTPVLQDDGLAITFYAKKDNLLDVENGVKTVDVTVPADFYYKSGDYKVELGSEKTFSYTVNATTNEKINITFEAQSGSGQISPKGNSVYYLNDEITAVFVPNSMWQAFDWTVENGSEVVAITEKNEKQIKIKVLDQSTQTVTVSPVVYKRLEVTGIKPEYQSDGVAKNSNIEIDFSSVLSEKNNTDKILNKITVMLDGVDLIRAGFFDAPVQNGNKLVINATRKLIDVTKGTKTVNVILPKDLCYEKDGYQVEMGMEIAHTYLINPSTNEKVSVSIEAENGSGLLTPKGTDIYYLDDEITVSFTPDSQWQTFGWNAENGTDVVSLTKINENQLNVKVLNTSSQTVKISPVVYKRPEISGFKPEYQTQGVPKNSNIEIEFSRELSQKNVTDNIINRISVLVDDEDMIRAGAFNVPQIDETDGRKIIISTTNTFIDVTKGTKNVNVILPADLCYEIDGKTVALGSENKRIYRVNSETNEKTTVNILRPVENGSTVGSIEPAGQTKCNLFETVTVNYELPENYKFMGWKKVNTSCVELIPEAGQNFDANGYNSKTRVATVTVKITGASDDVIAIQPIVSEIPWADIEITSKYGRFSSNGSGRYREGTTQSLSFTSDPDYQFIRWQILNKNTNGEYTNWTEASGGYIKIEDVNDANSSFTLMNAPAADSGVKLLIEPLCAKRPKIVSYSPQYSTEGDLRDRTLVVMFSTKMDESSIYYTPAELQNLGIVKTSGSVVSGYKLLGDFARSGTFKDGDVCYGYYKTADPENSVVFKNIRICRLNNQDVNLLKYFDKPVFDKGNTGTLRIPTKITDETKDEAPPKNCEILVTLENGINYFNDNANVALSEEFSWAYYTNTGTDSAPPEFNTIEIKNENNVSLTEVIGSEHPLTENTANIEKYNVKNGKVVFNLEVKDTGSGVGSLFATFTKINNKYYPTASGKDEIMDTKIRFKLTGDKVTGSDNNKILEEEVDLSDYGLDEGLYTVFLEAVDKNDHKSESKAYQFVYDNVPPKAVEFDESRTQTGETSISWTNPDETDFASVKVVSKNEDETKDDLETTFAFNESSYKLGTHYENKIRNLEAYKHYSHKLIISDYAGNETVVDVPQDITPPSNVSDFAESRTVLTESTISWTGVAPDVGKILVECYKADGSKHKEYEVDSSVSSVKFGNLERGKYTYKVTTVDYSGNKQQEYIEKSDNQAPEKISITGNTRTCGEEETVRWNNSVASDFDYVIVKQYEGNELKNTFNTMDDKSILSHKFEGLINQTKYTYKISAVDYSGNESEEEPYEDNDGPETLVIRGNISNSRTSKDKETISWSSNPTGEDVAHVFVERHYAGSMKASFDDKENSKTNTFTELTNQEKYEYRFYSVDYSGNKSKTYTSYEDNDGPDSLVIEANISNTRISADNETITWAADFTDTDVDHIVIDQYEGTSLIKTFTHNPAALKTAKFEDLENLHKYEYRFYSVDYSGNKSSTYTSYADNDGPESQINKSGISNSRTSAETESVSWSADPTGNDIGGVLVEQYVGTRLNKTFKQEIGTAKTAKFEGLTNQTKYKYRFYSLDYSGNKSEIYTEYQDDERPTSLVVKENISNSRTSAEKESVSWSANPTGSDVGGLYIEQYDGTILNNTVTYKVGSTKTASFAGMINQHKYKYRFYSLDYSGNKSTNYIEYQDDTPPAPLTIRYSEGRDGRVNVFFTTPSDVDYYITKVSWTIDGDRWDIDETKGINNSSYKTFNNGVNWTLYNYYFRTYDYSGNCSAYVYLQEVAGAEPGMICYAPDNKAGNVFCSWNYYEGMNPIGIVCDGSNQSKVKVLELGRSNQYVYGPNNGKFCADNTFDLNVGELWIAGGFNATYNLTDGLEWWKLVRDNSYYQGNNTSNSIWAYLTAKNKNSAVTWWVPARHEWQYVAWNWESMNHGFTTLGVGNGMAVGELFYVSTPNWYNNRCNFVGVGTNDGGKLNEYLALGSWMQMWTTSWKQDEYYRQDSYGAYVRAMAFVNMK